MGVVPENHRISTKQASATKNDNQLWLHCFVIVGLTLCAPTLAMAQSRDSSDEAPASTAVALKKLSLEKLLNVEVTSVSKLELSIVEQNLLHNHHAEYGFPTTTRAEISRSVLGKVASRF